jgi:hypothetical protein
MIQRVVGLIPRIIAGSSLDDESGDFTGGKPSAG